MSAREASDGRAHKVVEFPAFDKGSPIPRAPRFFMGGKLVVADDDELSEGDGLLGGRWFADRAWEIDYPNRTMSLLTHYQPANNDHRVPLGFQKNAVGERTMHFASLPVEVDGEKLLMLLDTGATATTTKASASTFGVSAGEKIGTSFIEKAVFDRWQRRNPDWHIVEAADQKATQQRRMIEVPEIRVGGHEVGPVWFVEQPPGSFQNYMASMMDRPTWGALGGSALRHFRLVVDYPNCVAYFYRDSLGSSVAR